MATTAAAALSLFLIAIYGPARAQCECNVTAAAASLDSLLSLYERDTPPPPLPARVRLALDVHHANIYEVDSTMHLLADLRMSWTDSRLAWNASEWGCEWVLTAAERLWLPDVELLNSVVGGTGGSWVQPLRTHLASDGGVTWVRRLDLAAPLVLRLDDWPMDVQTTTFKFASHEHTLDELELEIKDLKYATVFESAAWEIVSLSGATTSRSGWDGAARRGVQWTLSLRRRAPAHAVATRAVLAAAALLLLAAGLLPPSQRAPLAAAASFTVALWLISALIRLPGSSTAPRALVSLGAMCACGAAAAVAAALAQRVGRLKGPAPQNLKNLITSASALCKLSPPEDMGGAGADSAWWARAARLLDAVLLAVLALTLLIILCLYI